ncbi:AIR synthase-related protein, partial [Pseudoalteromonas sp. S981]
SPELLKGFYNAMQALVADEKLLAYHDRSDGGLFTTVAEMAFAGRTGVTVNLDSLTGSDIEALYNEELGAVIQVRNDDLAAVEAVLADNGLTAISHTIGALNTEDKVIFNRG